MEKGILKKKIRSWALVVWALTFALGVKAADIRVDQIEITGVTVLSEAQVRSALELNAGDRLERSRIVRSIRNLRSLYEQKGYYQIQARSEFVRRKNQEGRLENILVFRISEGNPTRIAHVEIVPVTITNQKFRDKWLELKKIVASEISLNLGDLLDQESLSESKQRLEEILASEEYFGTKVNEVRVVEGTPPKYIDPAVVSKTDNWVGIEFYVDLGDRVTFGFQGNERLSRNELFEIVEEQRVVGITKSYIETIRQKITDRYYSLGYPHTEVEVRTFENPQSQERHVTFLVSEGHRVKIKSIDFDGNTAFIDDRLREEFFDRASLLVGRSYYVEKEVDAAAEFTVDWIKSQGYLSSKLITVSRQFVDGGESVRLTVYLYEGDQTRVDQVGLQGVRAFSEVEVQQILGVEVGEPLNLFAFSEGVEQLKVAYRNKGYLGVEIENENSDNVVTYSQNNQKAMIHLNIFEGHQYKVSQIQVQGLVQTREHVVTRELQFSEGGVLEEGKVFETEKRLRRLGVFSSVNIQHRDDPNQVGYKEVRVVVSEGTPGLLEGGVGVRNDLGVRAFGNFAYTNLWDYNHTWSFGGAVNRRFEDFCKKRATDDICFIEYDFGMTYIWPWFVLGETTFRPAVSFEKKRFKQFDAQSVIFKATLQRTLLRYPDLVGFLTYSLERTKQFNATDDLDNQTLTIGALIPKVQLDLRDNALSPRKGFFSSLSYEIASTLFGSQSDPFPVGYTRFQFRADQFFPLGKDITWFLSFRSGYERNTIVPGEDGVVDDNRIGVPLSKQFALGGAGSLRGFGLQELNVQDTQIRGTLSYVNYRTQIDLPFAGAMRVGPFLDAANLLVDRFSFSEGLRFGAGFGFHYPTPIGPVNFDWGFKIDPRPGEDPQEFYFSVGIL